MQKLIAATPESIKSHDDCVFPWPRILLAFHCPGKVITLTGFDGYLPCLRATV